LFLPFSAYPKPRTALLEEREDDEDLSMEYVDSTCLSWKEILSLTNNYDKVNSFLILENVLISPNYILIPNGTADYTQTFSRTNTRSIQIGANNFRGTLRSV
jgi:hypothetical protein